LYDGVITKVPFFCDETAAQRVLVQEYLSGGKDIRHEAQWAVGYVMDESSDARLYRTLLVLLVALLIAVPVLMLLMMGLVGGSHFQTDWGMMGDWGADWGWMMIIPVVAVIVLVLVLVAIAARDSSGHPHSHNAQYYPQYQPPVQSGSDATSILDRRLASGEITVEEYNRIKDQLTRH